MALINAPFLYNGFGKPDGHGRIVGIAEQRSLLKRGFQELLLRKPKGKLANGVPKGAADHGTQKLRL
jgi:hypothetical protein